jgi:putative methionine-R-sulfoxide reductase with GAF domain
VDSTVPAAFDDTDQRWLEEIVTILAEKTALPVISS